MLLLGGVPFIVEPEEKLNPRERSALARLPAAAAPPDRSPFRVHLVESPPWLESGPPEAGPAQVSWEGGRVRLRQRGFLAALDVGAKEAWLYRRSDESYGIEATLRGAMSARLPLEGGLPLHAAALVMDGRAFVFFGPSGAGKSTISGLWSGTVLSDELVAVTRADHGYEVAATGFWGTLGATKAGPGTWALAALLELVKDREFRLERLAPRSALPRIVASTLVPAAPPLWSEAIGAIGTLVRSVPCYRMRWSLADPPFDRLRAALAP